MRGSRIAELPDFKCLIFSFLYVFLIHMIMNIGLIFNVYVTYSETDENQQYSGLFSYHIAEDRWSLLLPDTAASLSHQHSILSRASHSMLFHPVSLNSFP